MWLDDDKQFVTLCISKTKQMKLFKTFTPMSKIRL